MIELRTWRQGDDPGLSSWAQCPYKVEAGGSETAERESETGGRTLLAWQTEAGPAGRRAWLASELEKARMRVPPWSLQKEHGPADTSSLTGEDLFELLTSRTVG